MYQELGLVLTIAGLSQQEPESDLQYEASNEIHTFQDDYSNNRYYCLCFDHARHRRRLFDYQKKGRTDSKIPLNFPPDQIESLQVEPGPSREAKDSDAASDTKPPVQIREETPSRQREAPPSSAPMILKKTPTPKTPDATTPSVDTTIEEDDQRESEGPSSVTPTKKQGPQVQATGPKRLRLRFQPQPLADEVRFRLTFINCRKILKRFLITVPSGQVRPLPRTK